MPADVVLEAGRCRLDENVVVHGLAGPGARTLRPPLRREEELAPPVRLVGEGRVPVHEDVFSLRLVHFGSLEASAPLRTSFLRELQAPGCADWEGRHRSLGTNPG